MHGAVRKEAASIFPREKVKILHAAFPEGNSSHPGCLQPKGDPIPSTFTVDPISLFKHPRGEFSRGKRGIRLSFGRGEHIKGLKSKKIN